jgi:hypothetical protein
MNIDDQGGTWGAFGDNHAAVMAESRAMLA